MIDVYANRAFNFNGIKVGKGQVLSVEQDYYRDANKRGLVSKTSVSTSGKPPKRATGKGSKKK